MTFSDDIHIDEILKTETVGRAEGTRRPQSIAQNTHKPLAKTKQTRDRIPTTQTSQPPIPFVIECEKQQPTDIAALLVDRGKQNPKSERRLSGLLNRTIEHRLQSS